MKLLEIENLRMYYQVRAGNVKAVDGISLTMEKGGTVGLVGESGCGKTSVAMSILRLLAPNGKFDGGRILFKGEDLRTVSEPRMRAIRWQGISIVFQGAMNALNPVLRVGDQIKEAIKAHQSMGRQELEARIEELYQLVGLEHSCLRQYPHQYSGGMKQRAVIAMALACHPELIIADEPTTALDVIVQDQILNEMVSLQKELGMTIIYISHDISIIAETCQQMGVMYAGKLIEYGDTISLFEKPFHPYTEILLGSYPSLSGRKKKLSSIPGDPPDLLRPPSGCRFHPRCAKRIKICDQQEPSYHRVETNRWVACHLVNKELSTESTQII